jgi:hypothetical protein
MADIRSGRYTSITSPPGTRTVKTDTKSVTEYKYKGMMEWGRFVNEYKK